jgi:hypothetical protein
MRRLLLLSCLAMRSAAEFSEDSLFLAGAGDGLPEQFWTSQGSTPTSMKISWLTAGAADSTVQYGPGLTASGSASQYTTFGGYTSGFIHIVELDDLTPGAMYNYRVGGESTGWSANMTFTACRGVGAVYPFTLAAIGDLGQTNNSNSYLARQGFRRGCCFHHGRPFVCGRRPAALGFFSTINQSSQQSESDSSGRR